MFASNVGSEHFVGLSGSGAGFGIGNAAFEYSAMYVLLVLGWFFMPVYIASNVSWQHCCNQTRSYSPIQL